MVRKQPLAPGERSPRPTTSISAAGLEAPPREADSQRAETKVHDLGPPTEQQTPSPGGVKAGFGQNVTTGCRTPAGTAASSGAAPSREKAASRPSAHPKAARGAAVIPRVVPDGEHLTVFFRLSLHLSRGSSSAGGNRIWCKRLANWQHPPRLSLFVPRTSKCA